MLVRPAFSNMAFFVMFTAPEYYPLNEFTDLSEDEVEEKVYGLLESVGININSFF